MAKSEREDILELLFWTGIFVILAKRPAQGFPACAAAWNFYCKRCLYELLVFSFAGFHSFIIYFLHDSLLVSNE